MELEYELKKEELEEHLKNLWKKIDKGEMRFVLVDVVVWAILLTRRLSMSCSAGVCWPTARHQNATVALLQ